MAERELSYKKLIHVGKLTAELQAALGEKIKGITTNGDDTRINVDAAITPADETTIAGLVAAHDPTPPPDLLVVDLNTAKAQAGANPLDGITLAQALTYIDNNVTTLATAKDVLKMAVKIIALHERRLRIIERQLGINGS